MHAISGYEITKIYKNKWNQDIAALLNCNLEIEKGSLAIITGKAGSGKSTLLRLLGGYEMPTSGSIMIKTRNGKLLRSMEEIRNNQKELSMILKEDYLIPEFTVYENIIIPMALQGIKIEKEYVHSLVKAFHMKERLHQYPHQLNLEMKHCVSVIRALVSKPSIILVDDPAEIVSIPLAYQIFELLQEYQYKCKCTMVYATRKTELDIFANHVIHLEDGKIVRDIKKQLKIANYV